MPQPIHHENMSEIEFSTLAELFSTLRWELSKMELRSIIIPFIRNKVRASRLYICILRIKKNS